MKLKHVIGASLAVAMVTAACGGDSGDATGSNDSAAAESLRVGFASDPDFTQIANYKWVEELEEEGLSVDQSFFKSSQDSFRALVAGELDVAFGTLQSAVVLTQEAGGGASVIASDLKTTDYLLISTPEIDSLEDLEGATVGISTPGDISDTLTRLVLEREGIDVASINFVQVGDTAARMNALLSGDIDAGPAHTADGLAAVDEGLNNLHPYGETVSEYLQQVLFASNDWLDANPNLAQRVTDEFVESVRWAAENEDEYIQLSEKYVEGMSEDLRRQAHEIFQEIDMFAVDGGMSPDLLDKTIAVEQEVGNLDEDIPEVSEWANPEFVNDFLDRS